MPKGLSGPKKFVLLVAFLAKGRTGISGKNSKKWKIAGRTMTGLLGGKFNRFYSNSAKDNGWEPTPRSKVLTC